MSARISYPTLPPHPGRTLAEARNWLRENLERGAKCPCCTQLAKVYHRRLNSGMARSLIQIYLIGRDTYTRDTKGWVHIPTQIGARSREEGKLTYWKLAEESDEERPDGGRAGWWRVTELGVAFVLQRITVPEHAVVYDGRCLRLEGKQIDITRALGKKFDYRELMGIAL